jgi:hypothetical protein
MATNISLTKRTAIFVEGQTELEFVKRLVLCLCAQRDFQIIEMKQRNGALHLVNVASPGGNSSQPEFVFLLANCCNDGQVATQIRDRYANLVAAGYQKILGLRDVYPIAIGDFARLEQSIESVLPKGPIPVCVHLATMEVEAWFIGEKSHFERIDGRLTVPHIVASGYDIEKVLPHDWPHPAATLHAIYKLARLAYKKTGRQVTRTLTALSYSELLGTVRSTTGSLNRFITDLESAIQ